MATTRHRDDKEFLGSVTMTSVTLPANTVDSDQYVDGSIDAAHLAANSVDSDAIVDGAVDPEHLSNPVRTIAADETPIVVSNTDHLILFSTTGALSGVIDFSGMDDGQVVHLIMTAQSTGSYTGTVAGAATTLTFNAAHETATVINDGTAIRVLSLNGATVV